MLIWECKADNSIPPSEIWVGIRCVLVAIYLMFLHSGWLVVQMNRSITLVVNQEKIIIWVFLIIA